MTAHGVHMKPARGTTGGRVLLVCTANLARSPLAAALLRRELSACGRDDIVVESAGTRVAAPETPSSVLRVAQKLGLDLSDHRGRQVSKEIINGADLVLTMAEEERSALVRLSPANVARTFTLLELHRLTESAEGRLAGPAALAQLAHRARPVTRPPATVEDIEDPVGRSTRHLQRVAEHLHELVAPIAVRLAQR